MNLIGLGVPLDPGRPMEEDVGKSWDFGQRCFCISLTVQDRDNVSVAPHDGHVFNDIE